jgi:hypothetical protein
MEILGLGRHWWQERRGRLQEALIQGNQVQQQQQHLAGSDGRLLLLLLLMQ